MDTTLFTNALIIMTFALMISVLILVIRHHHKLHQLQEALLTQDKIDLERQARLEERDKSALALQEKLTELLQKQQHEQQQLRQSFDAHQLNSLKILQESLRQEMGEVRKQVNEALGNNIELLGKRMDKLTEETDKRLKEISGQVEKRLTDGFEKTTATFHDILKRLALIDEAQKRITELSGNVISLQEVLADKRSRGAFGEVQLSALLHNLMPTSSFAFQHTLSNSKRVDCILFLPEPTGNISIDAKFPLESYRRMTDVSSGELERRAGEQQFKLDIRKHIQDIQEKYIIQGETADGAIMFIPAEAVFAEIHAHYPDLVEIAQQARVWMVSPTTMMAVLTTARAVLKDAATRKQVHLIQEHLAMLSKDFQRFQKRMDNLATHIKLANKDVEDVHKSSQKISSRFSKIERVELVELEDDEFKIALEETSTTE